MARVADVSQHAAAAERAGHVVAGGVVVARRDGRRALVHVALAVHALVACKRRHLVSAADTAPASKREFTPLRKKPTRHRDSLVGRRHVRIAKPLVEIKTAIFLHGGVTGGLWTVSHLRLLCGLLLCMVLRRVLAGERGSPGRTKFSKSGSPRCGFPISEGVNFQQKRRTK